MNSFKQFILETWKMPYGHKGSVPAVGKEWVDKETKDNHAANAAQLKADRKKAREMKKAGYLGSGEWKSKAHKQAHLAKAKAPTNAPSKKKREKMAKAWTANKDGKGRIYSKGMTQAAAERKAEVSRKRTLNQDAVARKARPW
jgi:hypothetical protein